MTSPSLARLTGVELRKAVDTRAGFWLLIAVAGLSVAVVVAQVGFGVAGGRTIGSLVGTAQLPVSVLLPVVGLLSVTGEWSQRTALVTFSLVPARGRIVAAKLAAVSLLAIAGAGLAMVVGMAGFGVGRALGRTAGGWHLSGAVVGQLGLVDWVTMMCGTAFGLLLLSSAPAVVTYYVLPIGWSALGQLVPGLGSAARWLDVGRARVSLAGPGVTGPQWMMFLTASLLWVALPAIIGLLRVRRAEIS